MKTPDPGPEPTRIARHQISAEAHHDAAALVPYYMKLQERFAERLVSEPKRPRVQREEQGNAGRG